MKVELKPDELVHFGMQIEERGFQFFQALAVQTGDPEVKKVFEFLSDEEEKHYQAFGKILEEIKSYGPPEYYMDEYEAYVWLLAKNHVLTGKAEPGEYLKKVKTPVDAVELALTIEKDTIVFFVALKKIVPPEGQKTLDLMIEQENLHIKSLTELKKKLTGTESC